MGKIRVLVVEDSLTVRKQLIQTLSADPEFEVVGEAADGQVGVELCQSLRPDVVTMDMVLPKINGLAATEQIMARCPTPIVIISSPSNRGEALQTFDALKAGAVDAFDKPAADERSEIWEGKLLSTVRVASRVKVITRLRGTLGSPATKDGRGKTVTASDQQRYRLLAIGASTGGPAAILDILKFLPKDFPLPILFVIHLGSSFGTPFVNWLDGLSPIRVAHAQDGEPLPRLGESRIIMAPPDFHLRVQDRQLRLSKDAERHSCRPSVDVLFDSLARELGDTVIACLLTGMGRDGAEGLLAIRRAGGTTIAQDEASSVVFGMPREAIAIGAAEHILPPAEIAPLLLTLSSRRRLGEYR